jgi:hypothetical protein
MDTARQLLDDYLAVAPGRQAIPDTHPALQAILEADGETRAALVCAAAERLTGAGGLAGLLHLGGGRLDYWASQGLRALISRVLRTSPAFSEEQLVALLEAQGRASMFVISLAGPLRAAEQHLAARGLTPALERALRAARARLAKAPAPAADTRKLLSRLKALLEGEQPGAALVLDRDAWGQALFDWLEGLPSPRHEAWRELLQHASEASGKSKPTQKWARRAAELVETLGAAELAERLAAWMESAKLGYTHKPEWGQEVEVGISDVNQELLKGLVWAAAAVADPQLAHAVARFGERCFKKIKNFGAASTKLGNACLHALAGMPDGIGVAHLSRLTEKIKYASGKRVLERALDGAAARAGQTREDLEELAVPDAGLDVSGVRRVPVGDHQAELCVLEGSRVELRWLRPDGKPQAGVPKAVKDAHSDAVRALKKEHKQLEDLLEGQTARLQRLWMADRRLPLGELRRRYLEQPLVGQIGRRLIWLAEIGGRRVELLWQEGKLAPLGGSGSELPDDAEARLWHVLDCADLEQLLVWRDLLEAKQLQQPFKQVWREVYRPRDGAATADERFAGHIIRQHPFRNLCQQRGWQYGIQGYWDSANYPTLILPRWGLTAALAVEPLAHQRDDNYIFAYLVVGGVTFYRSDAVAITETPLRLDEIPPLVFSEVMRDVDLFVGVSTVANEPSFDEAGIKEEWQRYWTGAVFGELAPLAETRRAVLTRVLPRTILRDRARVEDRWLIVGEHRVHLGTAQVRREGSDQPVAVEADRTARARAATVFLPFEGDGILTSILAKAFVLAGE